MLGDAGSNVIGAVLGLAVVLECTALTRTVVLVVLGALTLASEFISFSRVIERVPPLRRLDELGRGASDHRKRRRRVLPSTRRCRRLPKGHVRWPSTSS